MEQRGVTAGGARHVRLWVLLISAGTLLAGAGIVATGAFGGKVLKTESATTQIAPQESGSATAECEKPRKAVSGGWSSDLDTTDPASPSWAEPYASSRGGRRSWTTSAIAVADLEILVRFTGHAYCREQALKTRTASVEIAPAAPGDPTEGRVTARCKRGTRVVSGGFAGEPPGQVAVIESHRVGKRKWTVLGSNLESETAALVAQANCGKVDRLPRRSAERRFGGFEPHDLKAKCRRGERVLSGGFEIDRLPQIAGLILGTFRKAGKRGWLAEAAGGGSARPRLTTFAYCEKEQAD
jgi:hypothetical protein